jgi:DNA-binding CsgD family transcriptional regulator
VKYTGRHRTMNNDEIVAMYETGVDSLTIAIRAGCCDTTVLDIVRQAGGTIRPRGRKPRKVLALSDDEVLRLYRSGLSGVVIADRAGCTPNTIYTILRNSGAPVRASFSAAKAARRKRRA